MTKTTETKPITVKLITDAKAINTAITSIGKRGKTMDKDIHTVAVSCLVHADKHGDITLANNLMGAMPKTARNNALRDWFLAFGKFDYDQKSKGFTFAKGKTSKITEATNTPYWEFKPETAYVPFNAEAFITQAIKRLESYVAKGEEVPQALLNGMNDLKAVITTPAKKDVLAA